MRNIDSRNGGENSEDVSDLTGNAVVGNVEIYQLRIDGTGCDIVELEIRKVSFNVFRYKRKTEAKGGEEV